MSKFIKLTHHHQVYIHCFSDSVVTCELAIVTKHVSSKSENGN